MASRRAEAPAQVALASRERLRPPTVAAGAETRLVRLSPDGRSLAYVVEDSHAAGIFVAERDGGAARAVALGDERVADLAWSPEGGYLAYVVGRGLPTGLERSVGWVKSSEEGELGRVSGASFAWSGEGKLVLADLRRQQVVHLNIKSGKQLELADIADDGDLLCPPRLASSPRGKHLAFTCRRAAHDVSEVWVLARKGKREGKCNLLTQVPGADAFIQPFWSPGGRSLGLGIVHAAQERSAVIVVRHMRGDGVILHHHELLDAPHAPAWSPSRRSVAMWMATRRGQRADSMHTASTRVELVLGPQQLVLFDTKTHTVQSLATDLTLGSLRFFDEGRRLVVDGGSVAEVLTFAEAL